MPFNKTQFNFSTSSNQLPETFFTFKTHILIREDHKNTIKQQIRSILDSGSLCNFISSSLVNKLNLTTHKLQNKILIKGISGDTESINNSVTLKFQIKLLIKNEFRLIRFKQNFLVSDHIPVDLLLGNQFMNKYHIHYNYNKNYIYSTLGLKHFKSNKTNFKKFIF